MQLKVICSYLTRLATSDMKAEIDSSENPGSFVGSVALPSDGSASRLVEETKVEFEDFSTATFDVTCLIEANKKEIVHEKVSLLSSLPH